MILSCHILPIASVCCSRNDTYYNQSKIGAHANSGSDSRESKTFRFHRRVAQAGPMKDFNKAQEMLQPLRPAQDIQDKEPFTKTTSQSLLNKTKGG